MWPGRMEEILPNVYFDCAHNVTAIQGFVESVATDPSKKVIVFATASDKDYDGMISWMATKMKVCEYVVTKIPGDRSVGTCTIKKIFEKHTRTPIKVIESPYEALKHAINTVNNLKDRDIGKVYCLGSMYLAAEVKEGARRIKNARF